jgi:hypothetical protein
MVTVRESIRLKTRTAGKGGWLVDTRSGADYSRALGAWGKLERTADRSRGLYREAIELYDGTTIVSEAELADHRD